MKVITVVSKKLSMFDTTGDSVQDRQDDTMSDNICFALCSADHMLISPVISCNEHVLLLFLCLRIALCHRSLVTVL